MAKKVSTHRIIDISKTLDQWGPIEGKLLYPSFWHVATTKFASKLSGTPWPTYIGIHNKDTMEYYWVKDEMQKRGETALKKWILPKTRRQELWTKYMLEVRFLEKVVRNIDVRNFEHAEQLYKGLIMLWAYALVPELANFAAPEYLKKQIRPLVPEDRVEEILEILLAPEKLSFLQEGELALLKIRLSAKNKKELMTKLGKHAKKWYWIENGYYKNKVLKASDFYAQIRGKSRTQLRKSLENIGAYHAKVEKRKTETIRKYRLPKKIEKIAKASSFSIWWQDHRKRTTWWVHSFLDKFNEFAKTKYKLKIDDLMNYRAQEWRDLFVKNKKVPVQLIAKRKS